MAVGNPWFSAVQQTAPTYVPLPFNELMQAGQAIQGRYDANLSALDQTAVGLASIEARLPGHRQYVADYANKFQTEASELLSRYNNNAADPQFTRELTRLRSRYANDPNLRTVMMANEADKRNAELAAKMAAEGKLFINPQARGIDSQGRLINDVGQVRAVNTLENWEDRLKIAHQSMINDGQGWESNEPNLMSARSQIEQAIQSGAPEVRDLIQAYVSQGMSPEDASRQVLTNYQRLSGQYGVKRDRDWGYDNNLISRANLSLRQQELEFNKAKESAKYDRLGTLVAQQSPLEVKNLNQALITNVDELLKGVDSSGNLKTINTTVPNTPENRSKYPDARPLVLDRSGQSVLQVSGGSEVSEDVVSQIQSMREELGNLVEPNASPKRVLETYKEYLKADNNAPTFWSSPVKEIRNNITSQYIGQYGENLGDAVVVDKKGKSTRVASGDSELQDLKGFDFTGITTSPVKGKGYELNGAIKATAINKDGELVTIYKPLPPILQEAIPLSTTVDRALTSGMTNDQLKNDASFRILGRNIVPQKRSGRIAFYEIDSNGKIVGDEFNPQQVQDILNREKARISEYFSLHQNID